MPPVGMRYAPLSYSQLQHWNAYRLHERSALRHVASVTRLSGPLDFNALQRSLVEVVRRHDALRTRIVIREGELAQAISPLAESEIKIESASEGEVQRHIEQLILEPIDPAYGPLFATKLLRLRDDEHVLLVAMEHMISDVISSNLVLEELFSAYAQAVAGETFSLPFIAVQFPDYAIRQQNEHPLWLDQHGAYWQERLLRDTRLKFPETENIADPFCLGWSAVPFRVSKELRARLVEWCEPRKTSVVRAAFAAYSALVLRWCRATDGVIQFATHGRSNPDFTQAIGYFASVLYPRLELHDDERFSDFLDHVSKRYREAAEHADAFYWDAQLPRPEISRNTVFNWLPREPKIDLSRCGLSHAVMPFANPLLRSLERDNEPVISLRDVQGEILGAVLYPLNRFTVKTMERFARNYVTFLERMAEDGKVPADCD